MTNLSMTRGDSATFVLTLTDGDGDALDLEDATIAFTAKREIFHDDEDAVISKSLGSGITVADPALGIAQLALSPTDTASLDSGTLLYWDVQIERAGDIRTPLSGKLHIIGDVTRSVDGS